MNKRWRSVQQPYDLQNITLWAYSLHTSGARSYGVQLNGFIFEKKKNEYLCEKISSENKWGMEHPLCMITWYARNAHVAWHYACESTSIIAYLHSEWSGYIRVYTNFWHFVHSEHRPLGQIKLGFDSSGRKKIFAVNRIHRNGLSRIITFLWIQH